MLAALCCLSHSPVVGLHDPPSEVLNEVDVELARARAFVADFDPDLIVMFGVDHFNGFLYKLLPQFCIASAATAMGDYGTPAGALAVPASLAEECADFVVHAGVDVAYSAEMVVDHAFAQPLARLTGSLDALPVIPVFVNAAGAPRSPLRRSRALGKAVGEWAAGTEERVLLVGSGGLSHDPPVPALTGAGPALRDRLVRGLSPDAQRQRERDTVALTRSFAAGETDLRSLDPDFDHRFLHLVATCDLEAADGWSDQWLTEHFGRAVHEIRTWLAAFSALAAFGPYESINTYYRPVPEWLVGFGLALARTASSRMLKGEVT